MLLDISLKGEAVSIQIDNPHRADYDAINNEVSALAGKLSLDISSLGIPELVPRMIRGVAGCEAGCPADAKGLVTAGFKSFKLEYIEGGILSAESEAGDSPVVLKLFPDF